MRLRELEGLALEGGQVDLHHLPAAGVGKSACFFCMRFCCVHVQAGILKYVRETPMTHLVHDRGKDPSSPSSAHCLRSHRQTQHSAFRQGMRSKAGSRAATTPIGDACLACQGDGTLTQRCGHVPRSPSGREVGLRRGQEAQDILKPQAGPRGREL